MDVKFLDGNLTYMHFMKSILRILMAGRSTTASMSIAVVDFTVILETPL